MATDIKTAFSGVIVNRTFKFRGDGRRMFCVIRGGTPIKVDLVRAIKLAEEIIGHDLIDHDKQRAEDVPYNKLYNILNGQKVVGTYSDLSTGPMAAKISLLNEDCRPD